MQQDADWNALPPAEKARTLAEQARQAQREGQDQLAYGYYVQSLNLYRGLEDRHNIVRLLIRISYLVGWADFGDGLDMFTRRQKLGEEALPLAREIGDGALLAEALCAFAAGQSGETAVKMLEESKALAEASGEKALLARALSRLGSTLSLQGDHEHARALNEQALELYQESGDKSGMAGVLFALSIRARGEEKRNYLERALELQRELGAKKRMAEILMLLEAECDIEELDRREAYNQEVLELCRQFGSPIWEASSLKRLAEIARLRGDSARADALEAESKSVYDEPELDPALEEALQEVFGSGDTEKATEVLKQMFKA
jgi:tetratricopeptide (TPR) repeat protein